MTIQAAVPQARMLTIRWTDGSVTEYPFQFLRDNCISGFHAETRERQFDLLSVPETLAPTRVSVEGDAILVDWQGEPPHRSRFEASWLAAHRPGRRNHDPADVAVRSWGAELAGAVPSADAQSLLNDDAALLSWLMVTKEVGLSVVRNLEGGEEAGLAVGERIGFLRRTNFGVTFRVETKPDPNNLAFTSHALPLHTDLPNQEMPPGFQFLHCIVNDAEGGESVFADGFRIAEIVREKDPAGFDLLTRIPIPYRFHDRDTDIRVHRPMIGLDERGRPFDIRYSAHLMDAFDMEAADMVDYYRAYRIFMSETRDPANMIRFKLGSGQMAVFDNRRVLHGRSAFNPSTGHRLLHGFYVDRGEFDSRIRVLSPRT
jgi:gamma-butyrobetaine dioxygenase